MRMNDTIFGIVVNIPVMVVMAVFLMSDAFTLPPLPALSPKGIFNVLWTIFLLVTLAQMAFMFFVKKNTDDTVVFGLMASIGLITLPIIIEPLLEQ